MVWPSVDVEAFSNLLSCSYSWRDSYDSRWTNSPNLNSSDSRSIASSDRRSYSSSYLRSCSCPNDSRSIASSDRRSYSSFYPRSCSCPNGSHKLAKTQCYHRGKRRRLRASRCTRPHFLPLPVLEENKENAISKTADDLIASQATWTQLW